MKEYLIKPGFLDRQRKLVLTDDYLEWENRDLKGKEFSRLYKSDIVDFKHGTDRIAWYKFTVGRRFSITFKDKKNRELKIEFKSTFGLNKDNSQKYSEIVDDIWKYYHSDIVDSHLDKFYSNGAIEIQGIELKNDGVKLTGRMGMIPWDKVATKEYYRYFAIYNKDNSDIHSTVAYNEFGTEILWSSIKTILREMNASQQQLP